MSFLDFLFICFLLWFITVIALVLTCDGDLSLMFCSKFGKKICKFDSVLETRIQSQIPFHFQTN